METVDNKTLESVFMKIYKTDGLTEALKDLFNYENDYILSVYEGVIRNYLKELKIFHYNSYNVDKLIKEICDMKNNVKIFSNNGLKFKNNNLSIADDLKKNLSDKIALLEEEIENIIINAFPDKSETEKPTEKFLNALFANKNLGIKGIYAAIVDYVGEDKVGKLNSELIMALIEEIKMYSDKSFLFPLNESDTACIKENVSRLAGLIDSSNSVLLSDTSNKESFSFDEQVERIRGYYNRLAEFDIEIMTLTQQIESIKLSKQEYIDSYNNQGIPKK